MNDQHVPAVADNAASNVSYENSTIRPIENENRKDASGSEPVNLPDRAEKEGKGGEGGVGDVTNAEFVSTIFQQAPEGAFAAVCTKAGDPDYGGWVCQRAEQAINTLVAGNNNYVNCSSFYPADDGSFKARKTQFAACHFLMLDDVGTKVPLDRLSGFTPSWLIETSNGNFQAGIILAEPITDQAVAVRLLSAIIDAGLCDAGAAGPLTRWARMPVAINGKQKHVDANGTPFQCRLVEWHPDQRYTPEEIIDALGLALAPAGKPKKSSKRSHTSDNGHHAQHNGGDDVLTPRAAENPVIAALKDRGLYKTPQGSGRHDITCPWVHEHTDELDNGSYYYEPDDQYPIGGFGCYHSHGDRYRIRNLLEYLGLHATDAMHKPVIKVWQGDLHRVVDAAEKELANRGRHYQAGGLIVSVSTNPTNGDPFIVPTSTPC